MTFNKKVVTAAVGGALALGLGMPASADHDQMLLAPYVVKDTNRTTLITFMGTDGNPVNQGANIHIQYWTKSTTAANTAACEPNSTTMTFTDNDIVTFDTAGILGSGPLFGDTTNLAPLGTSISYAGPRHGYLVVQNTNSFDGGRGFWIEVDLANGGAHGDIMFGNDESSGSSDFANNIGEENMLDRGTPGANDAAVAFWATSLASSVFTVTPLGTAMLTSDNNTAVLQVFNNSGQQGAYDRNENGVDGTVPQTVRCVGRLTAAQLMPGVVANAAWAAQGGWGQMQNLGDNDATTFESCSSSGDCPAIVYQVDSSNAAGAGRFMQHATRVVSSNDAD